MTVYIVFFILLLIGFLRGNKKGNLTHLWIAMFALWLIMGLRDITVGTDTYGYVEDFKRFAGMNFHQVTIEASYKTEPLYVFISWLPSRISGSYTWFLLIWALFPAIALYRLFKRELNDTRDYSLAFIVCFILGLFSFYVAGIRQTAAMSILLWGYPYFKNAEIKGLFKKAGNKSLLWFIFCMAAAYLIHNSSIIFAIAFLLKLFKARWWYLLIALAAYFLSGFLGLEQISLVTQAIFGERFKNYGTVYESTQSISAFIMQLILFLICIFRREALVNQNKENNFLFNAMLLGLLFQSLSGHLAEMARVSFYFCSFAMILVPRALKKFKTKSIGPMINLLFFIACVIYLFFLSSANLPEYHSVLWQ